MGVVPGAALGEPLAEAQPAGVYRPRQPRASPLYRLLDEHFHTFAMVYCARHPVALSRLAYRADTGTVTYQSDKASGPTAGAETVHALEFLARVVSTGWRTSTWSLASPGPARS